MFSDWYDTLDVLVTDYKDLGGSYSDEVLLNKMEHLASSRPARSGSNSWAQRIEFARGTFKDNLDEIIDYLNSLEKKDQRHTPIAKTAGSQADPHPPLGPGETPLPSHN